MKLYKSDGNGGYIGFSNLKVGVIISVFALLFTILGVVTSAAVEYGALNANVEYLNDVVPDMDERLDNSETNIEVLITEIQNLVKTVDRLVDKIE